MGKYRKKPVVIEAVLFNGSEWLDDVRTPMFDLSFDGPDWLIEAMAKPDEEVGAAFLDVLAPNFDVNQPPLAIITLEGRIYASPGDWIIRGVEGEIYPCKPSVFAATYDEEAECRP